jgi:hypothetical protein
VSLAIMLMTADDTPMSGIFLVLFTIPWSFVLSWLQSVLHFEDIAFATLFLVTGGVLNSLILYKFLSLLTGRVK